MTFTHPSCNIRKLLLYFGFLLGLVCVFLFCFYHLSYDELKSFDEARHGVSAYEMLQTGEPIVTTYAYSPDYWNLKPPLSEWLIALGYKLFGYNALFMEKTQCTCFYFLSFLVSDLWWSFFLSRCPCCRRRFFIHSVLCCRCSLHVQKPRHVPLGIHCLSVLCSCISHEKLSCWPYCHFCFMCASLPWALQHHAFDAISSLCILQLISCWLLGACPIFERRHLLFDSDVCTRCCKS